MGRADRRRLAPFFVWALFAVLAAQSCCRESHPPPGATRDGSGESVTRRPIADVLRDHTPELMALPGVVGTGQGAKNGRPAILVLVTVGSGAGEWIPHEIEGYPVVLQETGPIRALGGH